MDGLHVAMLHEKMSELSEGKQCKWEEELQIWWKTVSNFKQGIWAWRTEFISKCSVIPCK